ncbi:MAG: AI-2E family transporter [Actinomycetia bacterium]|nr:AI-2E family transporter [Actinomycetes bacterium]
MEETGGVVPARQLPRWMIRVGAASWYFIGFCGAVALFSALFAASRDITIPLVLGIVMAVIFAPLVRWLTSRGVRSSIAAALVTLLVLALVVGALVIIVVGLFNQSEELAIRFDEATDDLKAWAADLDLDSDRVEQARRSFNESTGTLGAGLANQVVGIVNSAAGLVTGTILGLAVLYYLLKDGSALVDNFVDRQRESRRTQYRRIANDSAQRIRAFARGRTIMAAINGLVIGVAAVIFGVPLAFAIAIVNFIGAYIPYLGAFIGGAFAFLLALSAGGISLALTMVVVALVVNLALENALEPVLLGDELELHPLTVLLVTVIGGLAAGMVGLILAAPLTAIGFNLYREVKATGFFD